MLNDDEDVLRAGFLEPDSSRYLFGATTSSSINRSLSAPLYAPQMGVDANPWESDSQFDSVADIGQSGGQAAAVDDDILGAGVTAASVLVGVDLPEIYDTAYARARPNGERVSLESLERVISLAELSPRTAQEILNIVVPAGALYVTHNEFNTAMALVACAQKNMDVSLDTVYQYRNDLPTPVLLNLDQLNVKRDSTNASDKVSEIKSQPMDDPWSMLSNGNGKLDSDGMRSVPTTISNRNKSRLDVINGHGMNRSRSMDHNARKATAPTTTLPSRSAAESINDTTEFQNGGTNTNVLSKGPTESYQWFLDLDLVKVTMAPEKEGFIFKHINYVVESQLRSSKVLRRYSDFYWLWETLLKRYPMRVIPNLPPKKLGGKDDHFLDRRQKGLVRFINSVVRHPVLKKDEVVEIFLTEPSEFLAWRRANPPNTDEEFVRKGPEPQDVENMIPADLDSRLAKIKERLPAMIEHYQGMCAVLERVTRLSEIQSREFVRYSIALNAMTEIEQECYIPGCESCGQVVRGYEAVARHMQRAGTILDENASSCSNGILENLKRHRDLYISFKELLERKERLAANQIEGLSRKVAANKAKVNQNRGVPGLEAEVERLDALIESDQAKITYQQQRDTHIRYCLAAELSYVHKQQAFISLMYQNYVQEQLKFTRQLSDNWKVLQVLACEMPMDPEEFA